MGCIDELNSSEELRRNSIYIFKSDSEFREGIEKGADYEFALICGDSKIQFLDDLRKAFKNGQIDEKLKEQIIDTIERLPGRIIIVGGDKPAKWNEDTKNDDFQKWIKKRIAWVDQLEERKLNCNGEKEETSSTQGQGSGNVAQIENQIEETKLKLYETWVKHLSQGNKVELKVSLRGSENLTPLQEMALSHFDELLGILKHELERQEKTVEERFLRCLLKLAIFDFKEPKDNFNIDKLKCLSEELCVEKGKKKLEKWEYDTPSLPTYINNILGDLLELLGASPTVESVDFLTSLKNPFGKGNDGGKTNINCNLNLNSGNNLVISIERHGGGYTPKKDKNMIKIVKMKTGEKVGYTLKKDKNKEIYSFANKKESSGKLIKIHYGESLSGSSSHFSILQSGLSQDGYLRQKTIYQLMENGLLRILVADERVARFVGRNQTAKNNLSISGVDVVKSIDGMELLGKEKVNIGEYAEGGAETFESLQNYINAGVYHILIIHQGILDKLRESHSGFLKREDMEKLIQFWKEKYFPYIIVTSGRGIPESVPLNAKFLPFSVVESTLMKTYHEKFILTNVIMKSLPARKVKNENIDN